MDFFLLKGTALKKTSELWELGQKMSLKELKCHDPRLPHLLSHGNFPMAYSTMQQELCYFMVPDVGYIAFAQKGKFFKTTHVLSDPVVIPERKHEVLTKFLSLFPDACFAQVTKATADCLREKFGFYINEYGIEPMIDVDTFSLVGSKMATLRGYRNVCKNHGVRVFEGEFSTVGVEVVRRISDEWTKGKMINKTELSFLARSLVPASEFGVRHFFAELDGEIVGYVVYDPFYENDQVIGYQTVIQRAKPHLPRGILDYINLHMIEQLKKERIKWLCLALSPFSGIHSNTPGSSILTGILFRILYERSNFYAVKQVEFHKNRYRAPGVMTYYASKSRFPFLQLIDKYRLCGVLNLRNLVPYA